MSFWILHGETRQRTEVCSEQKEAPCQSSEWKAKFRAKNVRGKVNSRLTTVRIIIGSPAVLTCGSDTAISDSLVPSNIDPSTVSEHVAAL